MDDLQIRTRHMVRMWKGYRDARCAWLEGMSSLDRKKSRYELEKQPSTALFLVIFAPRRGLLEAYSMQVLLNLQVLYRLPSVDEN